MLSSFLVSPPKPPILSPSPCSATHPLLLPCTGPYTGASSPLRTKGLSSHWCPTRPSSATYLAGPMGLSMCTLWFVHIVVSPNEASSSFCSFSPFSNSCIGDLVLSPMVDWEHPPLYLSGTGRVSQETAISGSCQQALVGIHNRVWVWWLYVRWIPRWDSLWMACPSVSVPHFVSVSPPMGILFPLLRRTRISVHWSSFFLSFPNPRLPQPVTSESNASILGVQAMPWSRYGSRSTPLCWELP
jgi:hypothetical protein